MGMGPGKTGYLSWALKQHLISGRRDDRRAFDTKEIRKKGINQTQKIPVLGTSSR